MKLNLASNVVAKLSFQYNVEFSGFPTGPDPLTIETPDSPPPKKEKIQGATDRKNVNVQHGDKSHLPSDYILETNVHNYVHEPRPASQHL